jgi:hypothetical protein
MHAPAAHNHSLLDAHLLVQVFPPALQLPQILRLEGALLLRTCQLSIRSIDAAVDVSLLHPASRHRVFDAGAAQ